MYQYLYNIKHQDSIIDTLTMFKIGGMGLEENLTKLNILTTYTIQLYKIQYLTICNKITTHNPT